MIMDYELITTWFIGITAALVIIYDVWVAFFNKTPNSKDTISGQTLTASQKTAALPFAMGVLMGHFTWPGDAVIASPWNFLVLVHMAIAFIVYSKFMNKADFPLKWLPPVIYLQIGIPFGHWFWPQ